MAPEHTSPRAARALTPPQQLRRVFARRPSSICPSGACAAAALDVATRPCRRRRRCAFAAAASASASVEEDTHDKAGAVAVGERAKGDVSHTTDVVVIGGGISGRAPDPARRIRASARERRGTRDACRLCAAGVLAYQGMRVCEAHTCAGGAAHSFRRGGYHFDSGPSFFFDIAPPAAGRRSKNALAQVLALLGEAPPVAQYDSWKVHLPGGASFDCRADGAAYAAVVRRFAGEDGLAQWRRLEARLAPVAAMADALPFAALRGDLGGALTVGRYAGDLGPAFLKLAAAAGGPGGAAAALSGSFGAQIDAAGVTSTWLRQLLDLESFVLSGCLADRTPAPEMAFVYQERHRPGARLDWPLGGSQALIDALVRGIQRRGGRVLLGAPVQEVIVEGGRAAGVKLAGGRGSVRAASAVVCSTTVWDRLQLLPAGSPAAAAAAADGAAAGETGSIVHLHVGFDATGLDLPAAGIHHLVVRDWGARIDAPRNVVNICVPAALDGSMAPPGRATAHVYYAANEPWDDWAGLKRGSAEYEAKKAERAEPLWEALERALPGAGVRGRAEVALTASPLTHARYLRRHRGSYGPAFAPGAWPGPDSGALPGLLLCGDSTFPGIGVPAAAASGVIAGNAALPVWRQLALLDALERV